MESNLLIAVIAVVSAGLLVAVLVLRSASHAPTRQAEAVRGLIKAHQEVLLAQFKHHEEMLKGTYNALLVSQSEGLVANHLRQTGLSPYLVDPQSRVVEEMREVMKLLNCDEKTASDYILNRLPPEMVHETVNG